MSFCGLGSAYFESFAKLVPPLDLYCHFVRFDCVKQFRSSIPLHLTRHPSSLYAFCSHFINSRAEVTALRRVLVCQCSSICLAVNIVHTYVHIHMHVLMCVRVYGCVYLYAILCCKLHKLGHSFTVNSCSSSFVWHVSTLEKKIALYRFAQHCLLDFCYRIECA